MPTTSRLLQTPSPPRIGAGTAHGPYVVLSAADEISALPADTVGLIVERQAAEDDALHLWLGALADVGARGAVADRIVIAATREGGPEWLSRIPDLNLIQPSMLATLISNLMMGLRTTGETEDATTVIDAVLLMARTVWSRPTEPDAPDWAQGDAEMIEAARLVEARLLDPDLGAESLMAALGLSRSSLYRAFRPVGGVNAYIRQRRLESARDMLATRADTRLTIAEVAHAHGFASDSHFSRAFRKAFGYPPGALRS